MSEEMAREHAKSLAREVWKRTASGAPFGWECSDCGEWFDSEDAEHADCGEVREASAMTYLSDALDIDYIVSGKSEYRAAIVCVGFGGPNVWIDTRAQVIRVAWWSSPVEERLPGGYCNRLDDALEELWGMR